jgi:DnaK suppressor protein
MSRKDALVRLHARLVAQRDSLRGKIADDMGMVFQADDGINDIGETASQMEQSELHSQLAALESRELRQIEAAISKLRNGTFGSCERCQKTIPIARLQALPFTSVCIECQRKRESRSSHDEEFEANWASAMEYERRSVDREVTLNDLDAG